MHTHRHMHTGRHRHTHTLDTYTHMPDVVANACHPSAAEEETGGALELYSQSSLLGELQSSGDYVSKEVDSLPEDATQRCSLSYTYAHTSVHVCSHTHEKHTHMQMHVNANK